MLGHAPISNRGPAVEHVPTLDAKKEKGKEKKNETTDRSEIDRSIDDGSIDRSVDRSSLDQAIDESIDPSRKHWSRRARGHKNENPDPGDPGRTQTIEDLGPGAHVSEKPMATTRYKAISKHCGSVATSPTAKPNTAEKRWSKVIVRKLEVGPAPGKLVCGELNNVHDAN